MHELFAKMGARLLEELRKHSAPIEARALRAASNLDAAGAAEARKVQNFDTEIKRTLSPTAVEKLPRVVTVTK